MRPRRVVLLLGALVAAGATVVLVPVLMFFMALGPPASQTNGCEQGGLVNVSMQTRDGPARLLSREQLANAAVVIGEGVRLHVPRRGIVVALAVAHQESGFLNDANNGTGDLGLIQTGIRQSLQLPHQGVGSDHGSLGIFQQQWPWWGSMAQLMDPAKASDKFYRALRGVPGWRQLPITDAGQGVQHSAYPYAYADDVPLAESLLSQGHVDGADAATYGGGCGQPATSVGSVVYPIPHGSPSFDEQNFGATGSMWAHGHTGTDLAAPCGTPVVAATAGTIVVRTDQPWSGRWLVEVSTGTGRLTTWYGHMRALDVHNGQRVAAGQQIGQVGDLGNATGCHLHFEVHPHGGGYGVDDVNPSPWLRRNAGHPLAGSKATNAGSPGFTVATFNTLGSSHTTATGKEPGKASGPVRTRGVVQLLNRHHVDLVGLQEFQRPQHDAFRSIAGKTYQVYSPPGDTENSIAWRADRFNLVAAETVPIPYFDGHIRQMPVIRLHDRVTGEDFVEVNVHNPADTRQFPHQARYRARAVARETSLLQRIQSQYGLPVILTGDLNNRSDVSCQLTETAAMMSAAGGPSSGTSCQPPAHHGIDWIFGSNEVQFDNHTIDHGQLDQRTSDHPFVVTGVDLKGGPS